jgi:hypothetical protein
LLIPLLYQTLNSFPLSVYPQLCDTVRSLAEQGFSPRKIAEHLNHLGFKPPKRHNKFTKHGVTEFMHRLGIGHVNRQYKPAPPLPDNEWYVANLAFRLNMARCTLQRWAVDGWVKAYRNTDRFKRWVIYADSVELQRLEQLLHQNTFNKRLSLKR